MGILAGWHQPSWSLGEAITVRQPGLLPPSGPANVRHPRAVTTDEPYELQRQERQPTPAAADEPLDGGTLSLPNDADAGTQAADRMGQLNRRFEQQQLVVAGLSSRESNTAAIELVVAVTAPACSARLRTAVPAAGHRASSAAEHRHAAGHPILRPL